MVEERDLVDRFLAVGAFAVVGASSNREKYGNKVLRCYAQHGHPVVAVNPRADEIEGVPCYPSVDQIPGEPRAVSVVAPPGLAKAIVAAAEKASVKHLWFQPGAEDDEAIALAETSGIEVIAHGPCLLVALGFRDV